MAEPILEQAVFRGPGPGRYVLQARSPGFRDDWLPEAERLCGGFGERPAGTSCPAAVFVQPLGRHHVAVVQAADQLEDGLGFHLLSMPRAVYRDFGGDPFALADRFPPPWKESGPLPSPALPDRPAPPRTLAQVQGILQRDDGPNLLGAAQVLVDGGRIVFERPAPDADVLRALWALLPTSTRAELCPASFAFGNALEFHALVVPRAAGEEFESYLTEDQAGDYPAGRYELAVQTAAEAGNLRDLDRLFARRSRTETFRLGMLLLAASLVVLLILSLLKPPAEKAAPAKPRPDQNTGKESP